MLTCSDVLEAAPTGPQELNVKYLTIWWAQLLKVNSLKSGMVEVFTPQKLEKVTNHTYLLFPPEAVCQHTAEWNKEQGSPSGSTQSHFPWFCSCHSRLPCRGRYNWRVPCVALLRHSQSFQVDTGSSYHCCHPNCCYIFGWVSKETNSEMEICVCKNLLGNVFEFDSYGGEKEVRLHTGNNRTAM